MTSMSLLDTFIFFQNQVCSFNMPWSCWIYQPSTFFVPFSSKVCLVWKALQKLFLKKNTFNEWMIYSLKQMNTFIMCHLQLACQNQPPKVSIHQSSRPYYRSDPNNPSGIVVSYLFHLVYKWNWIVFLLIYVAIITLLIRSIIKTSLTL